MHVTDASIRSEGEGVILASLRDRNIHWRSEACTQHPFLHCLGRLPRTLDTLCLRDQHEARGEVRHCDHGARPLKGL